MVDATVEVVEESSVSLAGEVSSEAVPAEQAAAGPVGEKKQKYVLSQKKKCLD
jgi:hypothetical protein